MFLWAFERVRPAIVACLLCGLAGCASQRDFVQQAHKANIVLEEAHNQVLLLNILRAEQRRPLYFTAISEFQGPLGTASTESAFSITLGAADANPAFTFGPTKATADRAIFKVAPLDTQEFIRGITQPVPMSVLKHYLDQGWPRPLLLSLLIRRLDIAPVDGKCPTFGGLTTKPQFGRCSYVNFPEDEDDFRRFQAVLAAMLRCDVGIKPGGQPTEFGPPLAGRGVNRLADRIAAAKEGFKLTESGSGYMITKSPGLALTLAKKCWEDTLKSGSPSTTSDHESGRTRVFGSTDTDEEDRKAPELEPSILIRSPEGVIYYLGELVRAARKHGAASEVTVAGKREPIFVLNELKSGESASAAATVEYQGASYVIPSSSVGGRSLHSLSLVAQLIGLQKKSSDLPASLSVRVIGQ